MTLNILNSQVNLIIDDIKNLGIYKKENDFIDYKSELNYFGQTDSIEIFLRNFAKDILSFTTLTEAKNAVFRITAQYKLCQKLTSLYVSNKECFQYKIKECDGACLGKVSVEEYNARVQDFLDNYTLQNQNIIIIDRGRKISEKSAILIENGIYKGFAFFDLNYQITNPEVLRNILIPMKNDRDVKNILQSHIRKNKNTTNPKVANRLKILYF